MAKPLNQRINRRSALGERNAVLAEMHPALRAFCTEMQTSVVSKLEDNIRFYHQLGQRCRQVQQNPKDYLTEAQQLQGVTPWQLLERAISSSVSTLRKAAVFARLYDNEDLARLLAYRNDQDPGFRIHWGHVMYLIGVDTARDRLRFEKITIDTLLDPGDLHKQIQEFYGGPRRKGGHPLALPNGIPAQLNQMLEQSGLWLRRKREIWLGDKVNVINNILDDPTAHTTRTLTKLQGVRSYWQDMQDELTQAIARLDGAIAQVGDQVEVSPAEPAASPPVVPPVSSPVVPPVASKGPQIPTATAVKKQTKPRESVVVQAQAKAIAKGVVAGNKNKRPVK
jgi:hypothetical protein